MWVESSDSYKLRVQIVNIIQLTKNIIQLKIIFLFLNNSSLTSFSFERWDNPTGYQKFFFYDSKINLTEKIKPW